MADNGQDTKSAERQGDRKLIMRLASYAKPYWKYFLIHFCLQLYYQGLTLLDRIS